MLPGHFLGALWRWALVGAVAVMLLVMHMAQGIAAHPQPEAVDTQPERQQ